MPNSRLPLPPRERSLPLHDRPLTDLHNARPVTASRGRQDRGAHHESIACSRARLSLSRSPRSPSRSLTRRTRTPATSRTTPNSSATRRDPDDGYKSGYPQLHAIHTYKQTTSATASTDDGYKSGYPQLHAIHTFDAQAPPIQSDRPQPSTGATRPSALEQQPWRSSSQPPPASSSAAAAPGSPSERGPPPREGSGVRGNLGAPRGQAPLAMTMAIGPGPGGRGPRAACACVPTPRRTRARCRGLGQSRFLPTRSTRPSRDRASRSSASRATIAARPNPFPRSSGSIVMSYNHASPPRMPRKTVPTRRLSDSTAQIHVPGGGSPSGSTARTSRSTFARAASRGTPPTRPDRARTPDGEPRPTRRTRPREAGEASPRCAAYAVGRTAQWGRPRSESAPARRRRGSRTRPSPARAEARACDAVGAASDRR